MWERAQKCIAQGALTNSKHPYRHVFGHFPTHIAHGEGASLYDLENARYTDYICGLGTNFLGYGNARIKAKVDAVVGGGISHSLPTYHEVEAAESLKELFHFVELWKFLKTGSEACSAAVRIARASTGRNVIVSDGYHGWADAFIFLSEPAIGIPSDNHIRRLVDYKSISPTDIAGIIVEPVITNWSAARQAELGELREFCTKHGIVLIFDEVITGFRFKDYSVSRYFNIIPDLLVIGKAMANGFPLAAVGGNKALMNGEYFVSSTYAGDVASLVACKEVVAMLLSGQQQYKIERLWDHGQRFIDRFNQICQGRLAIEGYPSRGIFKGSPLDKALLFQEAAKNHILLCSTWFYNFHLIEHDFYFFNFLSDFAKKLVGNELKLTGEMPISPFAERIRHDKADGLSG